MAAWQNLSPFPEVIDGLHKLHQQFKLVALSNGEPDFLDHLVNKRIQYDFDKIISVELIGSFKPHPGVYRRAAFVDRYGYPYEDTPYVPDVTVKNFAELADALI